VDFLDLCSHEVVIVAMNLRIDYSLPVIYCTRHMYARPDVKDTYSTKVLYVVLYPSWPQQSSTLLACTQTINSRARARAGGWWVVGGDK